jgi:hypothetical protein
VKEKLQTYCATTYARSGVNQIWILKNSRDLLANLKAQNFSQINGIKNNNFSTLYTTIPHEKLKYKLLISLIAVSLTNLEKEIFISLVISHQKHLFEKYHSTISL